MKMSSDPSDLLTMDERSNKSPSFSTWEHSPKYFDQNQVTDFASDYQAAFQYDMHQAMSSSPDYAALHMMSDPACSTMLLDAQGQLYTPLNGIPPELTHLSPPALSGSEFSLDQSMPAPGSGTIDPRSSTGSPESFELPANARSLRGRQQSDPQSQSVRFDPIGASSSTPTGRATRSTRPRKRTRVERDSDDEDDGDYFTPTAHTESQSHNKSDHFKKEEVRKQRIESEQKRRDELRGGYARLKEALPTTTQKSSKANLLDRAITHIRFMEVTRQQLQTRLIAAEREMQRLRQVNEALMLGTAEQRAAAAAASAAVHARVQPSY